MRLIATRLDGEPPAIRVTAVRNNYRPRPEEATVPDELVSMARGDIAKVGESRVLKPGDRGYRKIRGLLPKIEGHLEAIAWATAWVRNRMDRDIAFITAKLRDERGLSYAGAGRRIRREIARQIIEAQTRKPLEDVATNP